MKFRRRPIEVAAVQWQGDNIAEVQSLLGDDRAFLRDGRLRVWVVSDGWCSVRLFDWIVSENGRSTNIVGAHSFRETYEPLEPTQ